MYDIDGKLTDPMDMKYTSLPDHLLSAVAENEEVHFVPYSSVVPITKGKSRLNKHMISLITEGEKIIHIEGVPIHVKPSHILLLSAGNYLYTERFKPNERIKSIMVYFDDHFLQQVIGQIQSGQVRVNQQVYSKTSFAVFEKDNYLISFIESLQSLLDNHIFSHLLQVNKLNELLLYLYTRYPEILESFQFVSVQRPEEERIKQVMEQNLLNRLSVSELAFLCYMSLPTFKRKFQQLYHQSPAKWMQERRLEKAAILLRVNGTKPSEVYLEAGYENHSSFSHAFKDHFGVLPKDYCSN